MFYSLTFMMKFIHKIYDKTHHINTKRKNIIFFVFITPNKFSLLQYLLYIIKEKGIDKALIEGVNFYS